MKDPVINTLIWVGHQVWEVPEFENYALSEIKRKSTHENGRLVQMKIPFAFWPMFRGELLVLGRVFLQIFGKMINFASYVKFEHASIRLV